VRHVFVICSDSQYRLYCRIHEFATYKKKSTGIQLRKQNIFLYVYEGLEASRAQLRWVRN
jgi:hypothetical protein